MAKTAQTLVADALRWLGVNAAEETASSTELAQGLDVLNGMLAGFGPRGIAYAHTTLEATDTVNVPDEQVRNVMFLLANELAPEYEVVLSDARVAQIVDALNQLQAAYFYPVEADINSVLGPRYSGRFSIRRLDH
jgi:hypothetical protein